MLQSPTFPARGRGERDSPRHGGVALTRNMQADNLMDIDSVADRLALSDLPPDTTNESYRRLLFEVVLPRAQQLETELNSQALVNIVLDVLPLRLRTYRKARGRFKGWLEILLRNLDRDEKRGLRRFCPLTPASDVDRRTPNPVEGSESSNQEDRTLRLQQALDHLAQQPRTSRQRTDFLGMLLISLRLAVVSRLKRSQKALAFWNETRTDRAERQFPWQPGDSNRCIQMGWPTLARVWQTLAAGLEASGKNPTDDRIVTLLTPEPGVCGLSSETWRQWRKRAVAWACKLLGSETWKTNVEPWLETKAPRRGRRVMA